MSLSPEKTQDLHLEAYKILVSMLQSDDNLFWRRNDILIAINGGMFTAIGLVWSSQQQVTTSLGIKAISLAICAIGIIVCIFWALINERGEAFYDHWYEQLKILEKDHLNSISIFRTADQFFTEQEITMGKSKKNSSLTF